MGTKSSQRVIRRLYAVESRRRAVVRQLAQTAPLVIGSLSELHRRCGKTSLAAAFI